MDHRYIDELAVAERYVDNALRPEERVAFEAHLVDCQECTDRVLLAEMFHARAVNGVPKPANPPPRAGLVIRLKLWQVLLLLGIGALLLVVIPTILIPIWKLVTAQLSK
jgi:hypothetical protein